MCFSGVDDPVVVDLAGVEEGERLPFDLLFDRGPLLRIRLFIERGARPLGGSAGDDRQDACELLRTHHRHPGIRPREEESGFVSLSTHAVILV